MKKRNAKSFRELFKLAQAETGYWERWLVGDFVQSLTRRLDELQLSRSGLAERVGVSPAYITQVLRGEGNLTVQSMVRLARGADSVVRVQVTPRGASTRWMGVIEGAAGADGTQQGAMNYGVNGVVAQAVTEVIGAGAS